MCFKNLPIEFSAGGVATLKGGIPDPYSVQVSRPDVVATEAERQETIKKMMARQGHIKDINMDPVTRVAGALALHVTADLDEGKFLAAHSQATLFRGYEIILMGRDPRDAIFVSSRACGVCGGVHAHAAAYAIEMAMGLAPPPMGTVVRNLGEAAEMGLDNPLHLYILAGPDYSESVIKATNPEMWPKAERWPNPGAAIHGFKNMSDIMIALNPLTGALYREGLDFTRLMREQFVILHGKYPHPQTIVPGGVSSTITLQTLNEFHSRLGRAFDYGKRMVAIWDDITDFFYEQDDRYREVGARDGNQIDTGFWDDAFAYDATYENANEWGERRHSTPGVVIDNKLVTTRLTDINIGWEEFVDHSYYEDSHTNRYATDSLGNPLSPYHPWNKRTLPKPGPQSWKDRYTWSTAPRWDRQVVETGAYSRVLLTALAQKHPVNDFYEATGHSMKFHVPKGEMPAMEFEWHVPERWNAFERNRARAYHFLFSQMVSFIELLKAYELQRSGQTRVAAVRPDQLDKHIPQDERVGVGFWGAGRGFLTHHLVMDKGKIVNYQICTPSTINASPRDNFDQMGPYEEAVMNTPILEKMSKASDFTSVDMLRGIRSFDPCMPCTTHVHTPQGTVTREVNTCACGG